MSGVSAVQAIVTRDLIRAVRQKGRLVGGKPVPHVGWVFVPRAPVRGPVSRRAVRDASRPRASVSSRTHGRPSKLASEPMPVPKEPPPGRGRGRRPKDTETVTPAAGQNTIPVVPSPKDVSRSTSL